MRPMITQANHPVNHQVMNKKISLDMRVKDMVTSEEDSTKKEVNKIIIKIDIKLLI